MTWIEITHAYCWVCGRNPDINSILCSACRDKPLDGVGIVKRMWLLDDGNSITNEHWRITA